MSPAPGSTPSCGRHASVLHLYGPHLACLLQMFVHELGPCEDNQLPLRGGCDARMLEKSGSHDFMAEIA